MTTDIDDLVKRLRDYDPRFLDLACIKKAADALEAQQAEMVKWKELHRVIAEELGTDAASWPDHGNAPLAIAAMFVLHKAAAEGAEAALQQMEAQRNRYRAKWIRLRRVLRQLNKAHAVLWKVVGLRNDFHAFAVADGSYIKYRKAIDAIAQEKKKT
jgi:hypothetical protein